MRFLTVLVVFGLLSIAAGQQTRTIIFPKALRIGATENIILNLHGYPSATIQVYLHDLPNRESVFSALDPALQVSGDAINRPIIIPVKVTGENILVFRNRQKVEVVVQVTNSVADFISQTEILVSKVSGYLFVRTNRPIYRPGEDVQIQIAPLNQLMAPDAETIVTVIVKTPDGIGVYRRNERLVPNQFIGLLFKIPELPEVGTWFVEAIYANNGYETTTTVQFKIDRYVLPNFNVEIELNQPFILPSARGIFGKLRATYSYGEPVSGSYFIRMTLKKTPTAPAIPFFKIPGQFFVTIRLTDGEELIEVPISDLTNALGEGESIQTLINGGGSITVEAVVNGDSNGILEAASTPEIPFLQSPFIIDTSRTSLYFTPGLAYQVRLDLLSAITREPAKEIPVVLSVHENGNTVHHTTSSNARGEVNFQIDFNGGDTKQITLTTNDTNYDDSSQVSSTISIQPYTSTSNRYLQISGTGIATVGQGNYFLTFSYNSPTPSEIRYTVVARGSVVSTGKNTPNANSDESTQNLQITQDMVPSARVVAYYLVGNNVISNSFWFDVINQCKTPFQVEVTEQVLPSGTIDFTVTGESNALVGISAVDRAAYFLFNKTRITKKKMFDAMGDYDQGCVRNGGRNSRNVFLNAGLIVSAPSITPSQVDTLDCPNGGGGAGFNLRRKKRNADSQQDEELQKMLIRCDQDGRLPPVNNENCFERARRVRNEFDDDFKGCWDAFRKACFNETRQKFERSFQFNGVGRTGGDQAADEIALATPRTDFRENIVFRTIQLNQHGLNNFAVQASDSITTYEVDSISMANSPNGFCVADTENIKVFKDVFAQLYLPFSLKKREQAIVRLSLFNYNTDKDYRNVEVRVGTSESLCSNYNDDINDPSGILARNVNLFSKSSYAISFAVLPLKVPLSGKATITVKVLHNGRVLDDLRKQVLIEEVGVLRETYESFDLDVSDGNPQGFSFNFSFPENFVPSTRQCSIYAYTNFLGPSLEVNPVTGEPKKVEEIFRQPYGCGEQNMLVCGPNVYTHMYLQATGKLTPQNQPQYDKSIERLEGCYARELMWRSKRTTPPLIAFAVWARNKPSLWLNAFVVKVFSKAKLYFTDMDIKPICSALKWMIGEQHSSGYFKEDQITYHREMTGAVKGRRTLAAYTLISLEESVGVCTNLADSVNAATTKAVQYLLGEKDHATFVGRPYSLALLSYALALDNPTSPNTAEINNRLLALKQTSEDNRQVFWKVRQEGSIAGTGLNPYWFRKRPEAIDVEATAYALLAQIQIARSLGASQSVLDLTRKIVHWLVNQRNEGGAFRSTQDTVIGLQALATYEVWINSINPQQQPTVINVRVTGSEGSEWGLNSAHNFVLDERHANFKKVTKVPQSVLNGIGVSVWAGGHGEGVLSYRCTYKTLVDESGCHFRINTQVEERPAPIEGALKSLRLKVTISKPQGTASVTPIVQIGLMTGFVPDEQSVAALTLSNRVDGIAQRYDITNQGIVLYFREIGSAPVRFFIDMIQTLEGVLPQPAEIKVTDYYEPTVSCTKFYSKPNSLPFLRTSNCDQDPANAAICNCAEGGCVRCRKRDDHFERPNCVYDEREEICRSPHDFACRKNYVYLVKVSSVKVSSNPTDVFSEFKAVVKEIWKFGNDATVEVNSEERFVMRSDCYTGCVDPRVNNYISIGRQLVIYGNKIDVTLDRNNTEVHTYDLNDDSMIERYIPIKTCQRRKKAYRRILCHQDDPNRSPGTASRCAKWKKFLDVCKSYKRMKTLIAEGCD